MPKPLVFTICEKVIQDQEQQGMVSLIGLFNRLAISVPPGQPVPPPEALVPKEWATYLSWEAEQQDEGKTYMVCLQFNYPSGKQFGDTAKILLKFESKKRAQAIFRSQALPIGEHGAYTTTFWLEDDGKPVGQKRELKLEVEYVGPPSP